ncbi:DUF11 domain-containing protein [Comamonas sp. JC664]|uniref:DUF11 domain-containing protein n=1 Tax=Comamonas sp. JC664 TaxID=2801917 RepID=UPI00362033AA
MFKTTQHTQRAHGGKLAFQLVAVNHGPAAVSAARLQDLMPSGVEDMRWTCSARGGAYAAQRQGRRRYPSAGGDAVGASITIDVTGAMAQAGGHLVNTASVASELPDPVLSNNSASASVNAPAGALKSIPTMGWLALSLLSAAPCCWAHGGCSAKRLGQPAQLDAGLAAGAGLGAGVIRTPSLSMAILKAKR